MMPVPDIERTDPDDELHPRHHFMPFAGGASNSVLSFLIIEQRLISILRVAERPFPFPSPFI